MIDSKWVTPSVEQYTEATINLLPPGKAFPRDPGTNLYNFMKCFAQIAQQLDQDAANLAIDFFPGTTTSFLEEWQTALGLPDRCISTMSSFDDQRAQVVARLTATGESTVQFLQLYVQHLGCNATVKEWGGFITGVHRCGNTIVGCAANRNTQSIITIDCPDKNMDISIIICEITPLIPAWLDVFVFQEGVLIQEI